MKKEKEKAYRSMGSNVRWVFRRQLQFSPGLFFLWALQTPIHVGMSWAAIYLPSLVVAETMRRQPLAHAAMTLGALMLAMLVGGIADKLLYYLVQGRFGFFRCHVAHEVKQKSLRCFYQAYERKEMRELSRRATMSAEMWNGVMPLRDLPLQTWALLESVLCYALFGAALSALSPWLLVLLTLAPAVNWFCVRAYENWRYRNREKWTNVDSRLDYVRTRSGDFSLAKDIRIYGMAGWLRDLFRGLAQEREALDQKRTWLHFFSRIANLVVILLRDGAAYALLIARVLEGEITVDQFVLYFATVSAFAGWVEKILDSWSGMHRASLGICDLREYLEFSDSDGSGEAKTDGVLNAPPEITFDHVGFRYDGADKDTLHDVSFTLHPGEKIALVGLNGAGKTTLVKLLCGLYRPTQGEIRIDGVPIGKFLRDDYYRLFSPVFQDVRTAFLTLAGTVSCVEEDKTDFARAEECMRRAGLGRKLDSLPQGVRTPLDKQMHRDGIELSGGEVQKLMLARALYKDAPVLVLDEPTAALDPIAENEIYRQYHEMSKDKSSLFISHRLASTRFCDRIFYLKDGQIAQEGTHEELIAQGGEYKKMYDMQSCWYQTEREGAQA